MSLERYGQFLSQRMGKIWVRATHQGEMSMVNELEAVEIKAFVPARDFALSKQFYQDLGFVVAWSSENMAYLHHGHCSFLLQDFYVKEHADNFMMHIIVTDVDA